MTDLIARVREFLDIMRVQESPVSVEAGNLLEACADELDRLGKDASLAALVIDDQRDAEALARELLAALKCCGGPLDADLICRAIGLLGASE